MKSFLAESKGRNSTFSAARFSLRIATALVLLVGTCSLTQLRAQSPPPGNQLKLENAAVKYLRADAALRQSYTLPPDGAAELQKALEKPLDEEDEKLVAAAADALVEFHHGASIKHCDWQMSIEDGALANTAHRGAVMDLVAISGLRARLRFRNGDTPGAIDDVLAAMTAARHLSVDGSLASVLFAYKLERAMSEILIQHLPRLSSTQLHDLLNGLERLPKGYDLGLAFDAEKVRRNDFSAIVQGATSQGELVERLVKWVPALNSNKELAGQIVDGCGGSVAGFATCINQQQAFYASWAPRFGLPPEQFEARYRAEIEDSSRTNPLIKKFTPNLPRFRWVEAYTQTRRALLLAAIAVQRDGPRILNHHPDPYDGKPFSYIPADDGFRLESRLSENETPLSVSVLASAEHK